MSDESPRDAEARPRRPWWIPRFLVPTYDEASFFVMAFAFLLLCATDPACREDWSVLLEPGWSPGLFAFSIVFAVGMLLSLYHVLVRRPKGPIEKIVLVGFGVGLMALTGLRAGFHMLEHAEGWLLVFPVWNIASAVMLLVMYRTGVVGEHSVLDDDAPPVSILVGGVVVVLAWLVADVGLGLHWTATLSICVAYATNVNALLVRFLGRRGRGKKVAP